jgi:hypothetical protein
MLVRLDTEERFHPDTEPLNDDEENIDETLVPLLTSHEDKS